MWGRFFNNSDRRFSDKGQYNHRNTPNVIHCMLNIEHSMILWTTMSCCHVPFCHTLCSFHATKNKDKDTYTVNTTSWNWVKWQQQSRLKTCVESEFHSADVAPRGDRSQIKSEKRETTKLQFPQHQYLQYLQENIWKEHLTYDINIIDKELEDTVENSIFEDVTTKQCLMHEIKNKFICTLQSYKQKSTIHKYRTL